MENLKNKIKNLYKKGFFHIFCSNVLNKIMQFCSGIFIIRFLSKGDFGIFSYSQNLLSFFLLLNGFGISDALMQFGSKAKDKKEQNKVLKYSLKISLVSNVIISVLILLYYLFGTFKITEARNIFLWMIFFPIFSILIQIIQLKLRIELKNKEMSKFSNINTFLNLFGMLLGAKLNGIKGMIIGKYIGNILSLIISLKYIEEIFKDWKNILKLSEIKRKQINKFAIISMFNNGMSRFLYIADIFLIGYFIASKTVLASYKTATLIPFALNFIPMSVMIYIYPYFAKNGDDLNWIKINYKKLVKYMFLGNLLITIFLIVFSKYIIIILFGQQYIDSIKPFMILSLGYFFASTFRIPAGNILAAIGQIKFNFYGTIICGSLNILLDILLIKNFGSIGAAYATLIIFIFSGLLGNIFLYYYLKDIKKI